MTIRDIDQTIEEVNSLKVLTQAFGEIASIKLKRIRTEVERNRQFFKEIAYVFRVVKSYAETKGVTLKKPKGTVSILITSNERFYGGIDTDVISYFIEVSAKYATDRIVTGVTGKEYLHAIRYIHQFTELTFKTDLPNEIEQSKLAEMIGSYKQVIVFYPQITTILVQKPTATDVTQSSWSKFSQQLVQDFNYVIFEPELQKTINFFDTQIMILLLQQTFFEAELARTASRLLAMDKAQIEANKFIDQQKKLRIKIKRDLINKQILESFSSMSALKGESSY